MARCITTGKGFQKKSVRRWWRLAAEQGNPNAQFNLGLTHQSGQGVPKNAVEALRLLRLAAQQGLPEAIKAIGR